MSWSPRVSSRRRILCVNPSYPETNEMRLAYDLVPQIRAYMVPQGILTVAAYLPARWEVRVIDENVRPVHDDDLEWADVVLATGMHIQRETMARVAQRARRLGKLAVAGGPSVSACPEYHPDFHVLHVGELGDATDALVSLIDRSTRPPAAQLLLRTQTRLEIDAFPIPAYDQIDFLHYYLASVQWSSGCPFRCEFCDIPALYGRVPRYKSTPRLLRELDAILQRNPVGGVYFVDDNLIGNKKAVKEMLPGLIAWQQRNDYRGRFGAEASLNLATDRQLLALLREAHMTDIFFGLESPDEETLHAIDKDQNTRIPMLEAVHIINSYGIELSAGLILGFDSDGPDTAEKMIRFVERSNIPFAQANILSAFPQTPLWDRLQAEGRITGERLHGMNMVYKMDRGDLSAQWRRMTEQLYRPDALYRRIRHQIEFTHPHRLQLPLSRYPLSPRFVDAAARTLIAVVAELGFKSNYRGDFWRMALPMLARGDLNQLLYWATMGRYAIGLGDDARSGALSHIWFDGPRWAGRKAETQPDDLRALVQLPRRAPPPPS